MSGHRGWTAQDDEDLIHLADSGFELESVAWALGRSPVSVRARLALLHRDASLVGSDPIPAGVEAFSSSLAVDDEDDL